MPLLVLARKTLHSLVQPGMLTLMLFCAGVALLLVVTLVLGITWLTANLVTLERSWLDTVVNWGVGAMLGVGGWFMLPVVVLLLAAAFQEVVIAKVERAEYPGAVPDRPQGFWADLGHDLRFALKALLLNLLLLPFYFVGIGVLLSLALNSYLLGREFFENAAGHHLGKAGARELGRHHWRLVYGSGLVLAVLTLVPVANLFAPIIGLVWMVHVYHGLPGAKESSGL